MDRLEQALQLRQLALCLVASDPGQAIRPVLVFAALTRLQRARPQLVSGLRLSLSQAMVVRIQHPKLNLWATLARPGQAALCSPADLLHAIQQTDAWRTALRDRQTHDIRLADEAWNYTARLQNHQELLQQLESTFQKRREPKKLLFWHHFDALGYVPHSWQSVLRELTRQGWIVVVSSSEIRKQDRERLEEQGCLLSLRQNLGLCLGAYRDFCCLLSDQQTLRNQLHTLVLCNDSTLPIGGHEPFCNQMAALCRNSLSDEPQLSGLTDSVETGQYHLQSYCLAANQSLLRHRCWDEFWSSFDVRKTKEDLIQDGEIGLSQWLLKQEITLQSAFSLTSMLLQTPEVREELTTHDLQRPRDINLTLMAWKSLVKQGFPLVKKHVLLDPPPTLSGVVPMSELSDHLGAKDDLLKQDLEQLLKSRFIRA